MKVLIVGDYPDKSGKVVGGVQAAASALAHELAKRPNVEVGVLTCQPGLAGEAVVDHDGFSVHYVPSYAKGALLTQHAANRRRLRRKIAGIGPDIIHAENTGFQALAALESGVPTVLTVHGIFLRELKYHFGSGPMDRLKLALCTRLHCQCLARAKHVITISDYTWSEVGHLSKAETYRIDNPVDPSYFGVTWDPDARRILYVGIIFPYKGVEYLLQAMAVARHTQPDARLDLIGPVADESYYRGLLDYVEAHGLGESVRFLGPKDKAELPREYASSSMLVLPSLRENAPLVISEAMAVGCPVVATQVGGVPEMVRDSVTGFVVPLRDSEALAEAMCRLLDDDALRRSMGEQGRKEALERFPPAAVAEKTLAVYRRVLDGSNP